MRYTALVLAAGKGTRMYSNKPKVLQSILGEPMLAHVLRALRPICSEKIGIVIGHEADKVRTALENFKLLHFIEQKEQKGTGHALIQAMPYLTACVCDYVLVINGDTPLITTEIVQNFIQKALTESEKSLKIAFATITLAYENSYGKVIRNNGNVQAIIEAKDYDINKYGSPPKEVNAGLYLLHIPTLTELLPLLTADNQGGEYYLTDIVKLGMKKELGVYGIACGENECLLGVNSPLELSQSEEILRKKIVQQALESGVIIHNAHNVTIGVQASISAGAEIFGPCEIYGNSSIARGAVIHSHCVIKDSIVGENAEIQSFSHLQSANVGNNASVGPYARLRPNAVLEENTKVGNFVEIKKAVLKKGAKASHLSYIGDAHVGENANIGAGTITCNYDGKNKFLTHIGTNAFIGSNSALVAPVTVGDGALVGAGSVITKDIPENHLGIERTRQKILPRKK